MENQNQNQNSKKEIKGLPGGSKISGLATSVDAFQKNLSVSHKQEDLIRDATRLKSADFQRSSPIQDHSYTESHEDRPLRTNVSRNMEPSNAIPTQVSKDPRYSETPRRHASEMSVDALQRDVRADQKRNVSIRKEMKYQEADYHHSSQKPISETNNSKSTLKTVQTLNRGSDIQLESKGEETLHLTSGLQTQIQSSKQSVSSSMDVKGHDWNQETSIDGMVSKNKEMARQQAVKANGQIREESDKHQKENKGPVLNTMVKSANDNSYLMKDDKDLGTINLKPSEYDVQHLESMLNSHLYDSVLEPGLKTQLLKDLKEGNLNVTKSIELLKNAKYAQKKGLSIRNKNGLKEKNALIAQHILNRKSFDFDVKQNKGSMAATVGLKTFGKTTQLANRGVKKANKFANAVENGTDLEDSVKQIKTIASAPAKPVEKQLTRKANKVVSQYTIKGAKSAGRATKHAAKATVRAVSGLLSKYAFLGGSATILILSVCSIAIVVSCLLSSFTGSEESQESYQQLFNAQQSEYSKQARDTLAELEKKKHDAPGKGQFENISDEDYKSLIATQWKPDVITTYGSSNIDYKAQLSMFQILTGATNIESDTSMGDLITIVNYWMDQGIVEQHSTSEETSNYEVTWVAKKDIQVNQTATAKTKDGAISAVNGQIDALVPGDYSITKRDVKVSTKANYETVYERDEDGKITGSHKELKDYTATATGSIHVEKEMSKTLTQYIYGLHIQNGRLTDYKRVSNEAYKNDVELKVENISIGYSSGDSSTGTPGTGATGQTFDVPAKKQHYTFTCYDYYYDTGSPMVWASSSAQAVLADKWKAAGSQFKDGIAILDGRYLVATTTKFGSVGDDIDVTLENGLTLKCTIADIKSPGDANWTEWGHVSNGSTNVIEFEVERAKAVETGTNPGNPGWLPEWRSNVVKVKNLGGSSGATSINAKVSISANSKHYGQSFLFEELMTQAFSEESDKDRMNLSAIKKDEDEQIDTLYDSDTLMEGFTVSSIGGSGSFGFEGSVKDPLKYDNLITGDLSSFMIPENPFSGGLVGQCTWFAWSRFYQVYGYDSGARGNGATNVDEIVAAHPDKFVKSSTPAPGAVFSVPPYSGWANTQYGHVGFIEAVEGDTLYISEGNYLGTGQIWIHKMSIAEFESNYPGVVYAVPKD